MDNMTTEQLVILIQGIVIIVLMYAQHKSIPVDKAAELLGVAKDIAFKTESKLDDTAVSVAERVFEAFKKKEETPAIDPEAETVQLKKS